MNLRVFLSFEWFIINTLAMYMFQWNFSYPFLYMFAPYKNYLVMLCGGIGYYQGQSLSCVRQQNSHIIIKEFEFI